MGLPSLTRGIGYRIDFLDLAGWTVSGISGVATTDGDILTQPPGVSISPSIAGISTNAYPSLMVRSNGNTLLPGLGANIFVSYTDGTGSTFVLPRTAGWQTSVFALTPNKTLYNQLTIGVSGHGVGSVLVDFILIFKEQVTLPTASKSLRQRRKRRLVSIPIPFREGDIVQDLGSDSPEYDIAGQLIASNYTADQWWQLLNAIVLETGTVQSDGNPTWQWFQWDQGGAKVLPASFVVDENPGRAQNWDYQLQLKQFDVLGESVSNPVGALVDMPAPGFVPLPPAPLPTTHTFNWNDGTTWNNGGVWG